MHARLKAWLCGCTGAAGDYSPQETFDDRKTVPLQEVQISKAETPEVKEEQKIKNSDELAPLEEVNRSTGPSRVSESALDTKLRVDFQDLTFHKLIGKGSFKSVWRGRWGNTTVAIVSMHKGGMVTEARVLQRLSNHPNMVQFYRWSSDDKGNEYMVLELVALGSLDKLLLAYGNVIRTRAKLTMCEQICSAMCELAAEGVLHRDLAARNILVQSMDPVHVKVTDFGLARLAPGRAVSGTDPDALNTHVPVRWCSPEVLTQGLWSEKSDVWSFGVTMWEIFGDGAEPHARKTDAEVVAAVLTGEQLARPHRCPKEIYRLMQQCWARDPAKRPSFCNIARAFRKWREDWQAAHSTADDSAALPPLTSASQSQLLVGPAASGWVSADLGLAHASASRCARSHTQLTAHASVSGGDNASRRGGHAGLLDDGEHPISKSLFVAGFGDSVVTSFDGLTSTAGGAGATALPVLPAVTAPPHLYTTTLDTRSTQHDFPRSIEASGPASQGITPASASHSALSSVSCTPEVSRQGAAEGAASDSALASGPLHNARAPPSSHSHSCASLAFPVVPSANLEGVGSPNRLREGLQQLRGSGEREGNKPGQVYSCPVVMGRHQPYQGYETGLVSAELKGAGNGNGDHHAHNNQGVPVLCAMESTLGRRCSSLSEGASFSTPDLTTTPDSGSSTDAGGQREQGEQGGRAFPGRQPSINTRMMAEFNARLADARAAPELQSPASLNTRMMAELQGSAPPQAQSPGYGLGFGQGYGVAHSPVDLTASVQMSFDVESAIEPFMTHSTLTTVQNQVSNLSQQALSPSMDALPPAGWSSSDSPFPPTAQGSACAGHMRMSPAMGARLSISQRSLASTQQPHQPHQPHQPLLSQQPQQPQQLDCQHSEGGLLPPNSFAFQGVQVPRAASPVPHPSPFLLQPGDANTSLGLSDRRSSGHQGAPHLPQPSHHPQQQQDVNTGTERGGVSLEEYSKWSRPQLQTIEEVSYNTRPAPNPNSNDFSHIAAASGGGSSAADGGSGSGSRAASQEARLRGSGGFVPVYGSAEGSLPAPLPTPYGDVALSNPNLVDPSLQASMMRVLAVAGATSTSDQGNRTYTGDTVNPGSGVGGLWLSAASHSLQAMPSSLVAACGSVQGRAITTGHHDAATAPVTAGGVARMAQAQMEGGWGPNSWVSAPISLFTSPSVPDWVRPDLIQQARASSTALCQEKASGSINAPIDPTSSPLPNFEVAGQLHRASAVGSGGVGGRGFLLHAGPAHNSGSFAGGGVGDGGGGMGPLGASPTPLLPAGGGYMSIKQLHTHASAALEQRIAPGLGGVVLSALANGGSNNNSGALFSGGSHSGLAHRL